MAFDMKNPFDASGGYIGPERRQSVNADDFFGDIDRRRKKLPNALDPTKTEVEPPAVTGLREAPLPDPPFVLEGIDTSLVSTSGLRKETVPQPAVEPDIEVRK